MLISLRYRFLFVHIAKTGGTSIRSALQAYRWRDPWCILGAICNRISTIGSHRLGVKIPRHAKIVCAKEMLPRETFDGLFKFAFVRNPWDLQVSSWHHIKRERPHIIPANVKNFEDFMKWKLDPERPYHYIIDTSITPQWDYLIDLNGDVLVDFIGRYERLQEHFDEVMRRIGLPPKKLPHKRRASHRKQDYRTYYPDYLASIIERHFEKDIEHLGYSFSGDPPLTYILPKGA